MNKRIVAIGVLLALGLLIFLLNLVFNQNSAQQGSSCKQFLVAVQRNDAGGSYGLLNPDLQKEQSLEDWKTDVADLSILYSGDQPILQRTDVTEKGKEDETLASREIYKLTTGSVSYTFTCFLDANQTITAYSVRQN